MTRLDDPTRAADWKAFLDEVEPRPPIPEGVPPVPATIKTRTGLLVSTGDPVWFVHRDYLRQDVISLNVDVLFRPKIDGASRAIGGRFAGKPRRPSVYSDAMKHLALHYVGHCVRGKAGSSAQQALTAFTKFESLLARNPQLLQGSRLDPHDVTARLISTAADAGERVSPLRGFYKWALGMEVEGVSVFEFLLIEDLTLGAAIKGRAIRVNDPRRGALTWQERRLFHEAFGKPSDTTDERDLAITWTLDELGLRPIALRAMKAGTIRPASTGDAFLIDVNRVKQNGPTDETYPRKISRRLGELLLRIGPSAAEGRLFYWLTSVKDVNRALRRFVRANRIRTVRVTRRRRGSDKLHPALLPITAYRFRYTLGTTLAEMGLGPELIAAILDDRTLAMALIYTSNTSGLVDLLAVTLDRHPEWRRVLRLFRGKLAQGDETARKLPVIVGGAPQLSNFLEYQERIGVIGWCGLCDECPLRPPLSCYRCPFFIAMPDPAVHQLQLDQIISEIHLQVGVESDRMAVIFLPDMYAIREVIDLTRGGITKGEQMADLAAKEAV